MKHRVFSRGISAVAVLGLLFGALPSLALALAPEDTEAIVVSTPELAILECPEISCATRATAPLGTALVLTGEENAGYVPVRYGDTAGFVPEFFVATDPDDPPFFAAGATGCQRVAFLFNIGVGFEPDTGILDTLQEEDDPAAMFVMGWWAEQDPPILQRMVDAGYLIGSHGYDAIELTTRPNDEVVDDVWHATTSIEEAIGRPIDRYFTPYAAAIDDRVRSIVAEQGLLPVAGEVPAADYGEDATKESVYRRVMDNMYDGAVVEFHLDAEKSADSTGSALPRIIDDLRAQGYQFVTIPDMMQPC